MHAERLWNGYLRFSEINVLPVANSKRFRRWKNETFQVISRTELTLRCHGRFMASAAFVSAAVDSREPFGQSVFGRNSLDTKLQVYCIRRWSDLRRFCLVARMFSKLLSLTCWGMNWADLQTWCLRTFTIFCDVHFEWVNGKMVCTTLIISIFQ